MGNKLDGGKAVNASGVEAEFELSRARGVFPVPVGCTDWMAEELAKRVLGNPTAYYGTKSSLIVPLLERISDPRNNPNNTIETIMKIMSMLARE